MRLFLFISLFYSGIAFSQIKEKTANKLYARMEYSKCIEMFEELSEKCFKGKSSGNWENVRKGAMCYSFLQKPKLSIAYFKELQTKNLLTEKDREVYIQQLRLVQKYDAAIQILDESLLKYSNNAYFKRLDENRVAFFDLLSDSTSHKLKFLPINTGKGDFAPNFYDNGIIYATKSSNTGFLNAKYGWDDSYFINIKQGQMDKDSVFKKPDLMRQEFISRAHDGPVSFDSLETTMMITKNQLGKRNGKDIVVLSLYMSQKSGSNWGDLIPFPYNNPSYNVGHGNLSKDGKTVYFSSDMPGGFGEADIYVSKLENGSWSKPENLGSSINTEQHELFPFIQNDVLYFSSNGHFGLGGLDIFEVVLNSGNIPRNLGYPANSSTDDFGYIITKTEDYGYLTSNRENFVDNIYSFKRKPALVDVEGIVTISYRNPEPVANQKVYIIDNATGKIDSVFTDKVGKFSKKLEPNKKFRITTNKKDFRLEEERVIETANIPKGTILKANLNLIPKTIIVQLRVVEKNTLTPLQNAEVTIFDYLTGKDTTLITKEDGTVAIKLDRDKEFWAHGSKEGYIDQDAKFDTKNFLDRVIEIKLQLPLLKKGDKFKLENIFYDFGKSTLRPESMKSLDNLVDFVILNNVKVELGSHTDSRGKDPANLKLSLARAQSCVVYLIQKGVPANRIVAKGYGESQLVNQCKNNVACTEDDHQANRRTEVRILEVYGK